MSIRLMSLVFKESKTKGSARLVLLSVADNASDEGVCWPSVSTIAKKSNVSRQVAREYLHALELVGVIEIDKRLTEEERQTSNIYRIIEERIGQDAIPRDVLESVRPLSRQNKAIPSTRVAPPPSTRVEANHNKNHQKEPVARQERAPRALTPLQEEQRKLETLFSELSGRPIPPGKAAVIWHITTAAWIKAANGQSESVMRAAYAAHTHDGLSIKGPQSIDYKFFELLNPAPKHESREL